jgi:hypothetical protein
MPTPRLEQLYTYTLSGPGVVLLRLFQEREHCILLFNPVKIMANCACQPHDFRVGQKEPGHTSRYSHTRGEDARRGKVVATPNGAYLADSLPNAFLVIGAV